MPKGARRHRVPCFDLSGLARANEISRHFPSSCLGMAGITDWFTIRTPTLFSGWQTAPESLVERASLMHYRIGWLCLSVLVSGCSTLYVDELGQRHVLGLVSITLPPADIGPVGADVIRARSIGLTLTRSPVGDALVLGYSDATLVAVRNDAVVSIGKARTAEGAASAGR